MFHYLHRTGQAAAVVAALAFVAPQAAHAAPTLAASPASVHQNGELTQVRYYRHHWHGGVGPAIAGAALGLFALGANAAINNSYYDDYDYDYPYYAPYGPVSVYPGYGYYGYYPYGGYGGYGHGGWHHGWRGGWRGPVGIHNHR